MISLVNRRNKALPAFHNLRFNVFFVMLFAVLNPWYAISICAIINFAKVKVSFWFFTILFASTFAILFCVRTWAGSGDAYYYLTIFQSSDTRSLTDLIHNFMLNPKGEELLFYTYLWLFRIITDGHVAIFSFCNYFIIFVMVALLARVVDEDRFVFIILCILFVNPGFIFNIMSIWRHTFATLIFYIGIFLFYKQPHKIRSRIIIYSSVGFHLVTLPLIILHEIFNCVFRKDVDIYRSSKSKIIKWRMKKMIEYAICIGVIFTVFQEYGLHLTSYVNLSEAHTFYSRQLGSPARGYSQLFNPLTYLLLLLLWRRIKQLVRVDIFISVNYISICLALIFLSVPSMPMGRMLYVLLVGVSLLIGKFLTKEVAVGYVCLIVMIFYRLMKMKGPAANEAISMLLGGDVLNPVRGLLWMIVNFSSFDMPAY